MIFSFLVDIVKGHTFRVPLDSSLVYLTIAGVMGWIYQVAYTTSIKLDSPSNTLLFGNSSIFIALIGDYFLLGRAITAPKVLGSCCMVAALIALAKFKKR